MRLCTLGFLVCLVSATALAQGTYKQIDVPGATNTSIHGIDSAGDVIGEYNDVSGNTYGFLLTNGAYSVIAYPGAQSTFAKGMNDAGQIVGFTINPDLGFLYDIASQEFSVVNCAAVPFATPYAINDAGVVVGLASRGSFRYIGFELIGERCRLILPLGLSSSGVTGLSASGELVGYGSPSDGSSSANFTFTHGIYHQLTIPGAPGAAVSGISPQGTEVVGTYFSSAGVFVGFILEDGFLRTIEFPGALQTIGQGVNSGGQVVGSFVDALGNEHGFLWTPPADTEKRH